MFNGPITNPSVTPAFIKSGLDLRGQGLFYFGPPRPKPRRLGIGRFESDFGVLLVPNRRTYRIEEAN
jgi:hypothetical protein